jgi:hypothetical protein
MNYRNCIKSEANGIGSQVSQTPKRIGLSRWPGTWRASNGFAEWAVVICLFAIIGFTARGQSSFGNITVSGTAAINALSVSGIADFENNLAYFGALSGTSGEAAVSYLYTDGSNGVGSEFMTTLTRPGSIWILDRLNAAGTASLTAMTLTGANQLVLTGTQASSPGSIVIDPTAGKITINGAPVLTTANGIYVSSSGQIGIGTTSPESLLNLNGGAIDITSSGNNYSEGVRIHPSTGNGFSSIELGAVPGSVGTGVGQWTFVRYPSTNNYLFGIRYNLSDFLDLTSTGTMGVGGEVNPADTLSVKGNASVGADYSETATPANALAVEGNLGIGTTNPQAPLQIGINTDLGANAPIALFSKSPSGDDSLLFTRYGQSGGVVGLDSSNIFDISTQQGEGGIDFRTSGNFHSGGLTHGTSRLRILDNGNVGIGNSNPQATLSVSGSTALAGNLAVTGSEILTGNLAVTGSLSLSGSQGPVYVSTNAGQLAVNGQNVVTSGTVLNILTTGRVGIGTNNPAAELDVEGTSNVILNAGEVGVGSNPTTQNVGTTGPAPLFVTATSSAGVRLMTTGTHNSYTASEENLDFYGPNSTFLAEITAFNSDFPGQGLLSPQQLTMWSGQPGGIMIWARNWPSNQSSGPVILATSVNGSNLPVEVMRVTPTLRVGVGGETAPANLMSIKGNASIGSGYSETAAPANGMIVQGNVGIGTASPLAALAVTSSSAQAALAVSGSSTFAGNVTIGGGDNELTNQTLVGSKSILTEGLADARYASGVDIITGSTGGGTEMALLGGQATGPNTFAGEGSTVSGTDSLALGLGAVANNSYSTSLGAYAFSNGAQTLAVGYSAYAYFGQSIALGPESAAYAVDSMAIGIAATAAAPWSLAIGYCDVTSGTGAIALAPFSEASGNFATAAGVYTFAPTEDEFVVGTYNSTPSNQSSTSWVPSDFLFVVGNGTSSSNRSDALEVLKNGNTTINGNLSVSGSLGSIVLSPTSGTITVNGVPVLTGSGLSVNSSGNVGIGTNSPDTALEITGTTPGIFNGLDILNSNITNGSGLMLSDQYQHMVDITGQDTGNWSSVADFTVNGYYSTPETLIQLNGPNDFVQMGETRIGTDIDINNSGEGSISDGYELDLSGGYPGSSTLGGKIRLGGGQRGDGDINAIIFLQNTTEVARFANGGKFGVGTANPESAFTVEKDVPNERGGEISIVNSAGGVGAEGAINFGLDSSTYYSDYSNAQIKAVNMNQTGNNDSALVFSTWSGYSFGERMRVAPNGNVGVGTNAPQAPLDVNGTVMVSGQSSAVLVNPQGDLSMGPFTNGPQPE